MSSDPKFSYKIISDKKCNTGSEMLSSIIKVFLLLEETALHDVAKFWFT